MVDGLADTGCAATLPTERGCQIIGSIDAEAILRGENVFLYFDDFEKLILLPTFLAEEAGCLASLFRAEATDTLVLRAADGTSNGVLYRVLMRTAAKNTYIARNLCWVFCFLGSL